MKFEVGHIVRVETADYTVDYGKITEIDGEHIIICFHNPDESELVFKGAKKLLEETREILAPNPEPVTAGIGETKEFDFP